MLARKALAGTAGTPKVYVEDVFSTYLYTGTGATNTISNSIDLSGEGGLVWYKARNQAYNHGLQDTARGTGVLLISNSTGGDVSVSNYITSFNSDGFTAGDGGNINASSTNYVSWTFRKAEKFFDVVTYTGNGTSGRTVAHNLGSTPGCIIVKRLDLATQWYVYHRSLGATKFLELGAITAETTGSYAWNDTAPTSTNFTVGNGSSVNTNGATYVAYLFAHDAGGFGDAGSDNVISCGSFTTDGSGNATVNLGYEPQWLLQKTSSSTGSWIMADTMRGFVATAGSNNRLFANTSAAETTGSTVPGQPTATGFIASGDTSTTYIYIAIRRGPMKTPTTGTSVFSPITYAGNGTASRVISGLINAPDWVLYTARNAGSGLNNHFTGSRLQGGGRYLFTEDTSSEASSTAYGVQTYGQTSVTLGTATTAEQNASGVNYILYGMGRAPGFFDVVCYTGTGANRTISHNLGVAPELIIAKSRSASGSDWWVYAAPLTTPQDKYLRLQSTDGESTVSGLWGSSLPTSTTFGLGAFAPNTNAATFVAYLFASLSGVSKVGSYTGNGSSVTVTTNFQPRFILVKRTDSTGDWIVSDSARGLVAGNDPYLELNTADAEVTNEDWVDISSTSFTVNQTTNNANVNTGTYLYLAIA